MSGFVYLATQYSLHPEGHHAAYVEACGFTARLLAKDIPVFSPIAHTHSIDMLFGPGSRPFAGKQVLPDDFDWVRVADLPILRRAAAVLVVMTPGWARSVGIAREIVEADRVGIPVYRRTSAALDYPDTIHMLRGETLGYRNLEDYHD